jgi:hypothetical protein
MVRRLSVPERSPRDDLMVIRAANHIAPIAVVRRDPISREGSERGATPEKGAL